MSNADSGVKASERVLAIKIGEKLTLKVHPAASDAEIAQAMRQGIWINLADVGNEQGSRQRPQEAEGEQRGGAGARIGIDASKAISVLREELLTGDTPHAKRD
ncbi:hypothetical protein HNP46_000122 [Pseudomonas nitritireducens]|uniref:Uncharacterized protein n=1 Tax=Pseudomonas nitroreducens TaxID=46680 RepID=A0A7W7KEE3_PSENT|nr:hypothetical protein [Pseudomonas nitritireducens]MBB4861311.1 hypothetical protein [Pseudomonas nitritireducens]